jgi:predicted nucleotidyltransferase
MSLFSDPYVDAGMYIRIDRELTDIERAHGVRILLAVESGSRGWRFPSLDSDYDVRFLYVRDLKSYLSVEAERDTIERPIDPVLDISGWDMRKALGLMLRSNAVLLEWLNSPVRYRADAGVAGKLFEQAQACADLTALSHHYLNLAKKSFETVAAADAVKLKSYFYAIRAALSVDCIRRRGTAPPMDLPSLLANSAVSSEVVATIARLLAIKLNATEQDLVPREEILDRMIGDILAMSVPKGRRGDRGPHVAAANALFASVVLPEQRSTEDDT